MSTTPRLDTIMKKLAQDVRPQDPAPRSGWKGPAALAAIGTALAGGTYAALPSTSQPEPTYGQGVIEGKASAGNRMREQAVAKSDEAAKRVPSINALRAAGGADLKAVMSDPNAYATKVLGKPLAEMTLAERAGVIAQIQKFKSETDPAKQEELLATHLLALDEQNAASKAEADTKRQQDLRSGMDTAIADSKSWGDVLSNIAQRRAMGDKQLSEKELQAALGAKPGALDYGAAVLQRPGLAAERWWENVKGGDVGTIAGTLAGVGGAAGLYALLRGKRRKTAADIPGPGDYAVANRARGAYSEPAAQTFATLMKMPGAKQEFDPRTGEIIVTTANGPQAFKAESVGFPIDRDPVTGTFRLGDPTTEANALAIPDQARTSENAVRGPMNSAPEGKPLSQEYFDNLTRNPPKADAAPAGAPNPAQKPAPLMTQVGDKALGLLPESAEGAIRGAGISSNAAGWATAGLGAAAVLGGVLLANQLRKKPARAPRMAMA